MIASRVPPSSRSSAVLLRSWSRALPVVLLLGCGDHPTAYDGQPQFAGAGNSVAVTAANPAEGVQGETLQVRVIGSGFAKGAVASWERGGVVDAKVTVLSSEHVSRTELLATISIAPDASPERYDIAVTNPDKKKGIGSELFKVQNPPVETGEPAEVLPTLAGQASTYVTAVNGSGAAAGIATLPDGEYVFVWDGTTPELRILGSRTDIGSPFIDGHMNVYDGADAYLHAGGSWSTTKLPLPPNWSVVRVEALSANGWIAGSGKSPEGIRQPLRWRSVAPGSWALDVLPLWLPEAGDNLVSYGYNVRGINEQGQIVGTRFVNRAIKRNRTSRTVADWTWAGSGSEMLPLPAPSGYPHFFATAINSAGTIVGWFQSSSVGPNMILRWSPSAGVYGAPDIIGQFDGIGTGIRGIDDCGRVLGFTATGGYQGWQVTRGFVLDPATGTTTFLAPPAGYRSSVAARMDATAGIVGGYGRNPDTDEMRASLWRLAPCS